MSALQEFRDTFYTPERMVVVGVGVDHDKLVSLVEKYLG
jgi:predicted Zn-dependent peptidase